MCVIVSHQNCSPAWSRETQCLLMGVVCMLCCRFVLHAKKTAFVVEHDFIMATYLADRVVVFEGQPSIDTKANS